MYLFLKLALSYVGLMELFVIDCLQVHLKCGFLFFLMEKLKAFFNLQIGKVLKKLFDDGVVKREKLFITSKIWYFVHEVSASLSFLCIFSFPRLLKPLNLLKSTNYASTG